MILPLGIIVLNKIDFFNWFKEILAFFKFVSVKFVFVKSEPFKFEYPRGEFSPYKVSMGNRPAPRVTDENSPFALLDPGSPVFNIPNKITDKDFEGWVQERGLYFLSNWHKNFTPLLEFVDPGEEPAHGSLLVAPVGEGVYAHIALSLFRQFPAGVPGAYRLFANLVSLTANEWNAHHRSQ